MSGKPMLGDWEVPRVSSMQTQERRELVHLPVAGLPHGVYQRLPARPTRIFLAGSVYGEEIGADFLTKVREKYLAGEPITFVADILNGTDVQYVVIEQLQIDINAALPDQIDYALTLAESPPPPPPGGLLDGIDGGLLDQAQGFLDTATGALDALSALGNLPDIGDPTKALSSTLDEVGNVMGELDDIAAAIGNLFGL
jgi:hypothetical protein